MELETKDFLMSMGETIERLNAAATLLERTASSLEQRESAMTSLITGDVRKIVAAIEHESVEQGAEPSPREAELERRLAQAEQRIAELTAGHETTRGAAVRKTLPAATAQLLAKQGITSLESIEAGTLDAALAGLSLEQRIAVKSQLFRAGALS